MKRTKKMENRYGIVPKGAALECFLLFINFWFIAIPVLAKRGVKLRNDYSHAKVISMIIIVLNCFAFLALVSTGKDDDCALALFVSLPTIIGGGMLLSYGAAQKTYHEEVDRFVQMLKIKRSFTWQELLISFPSKSKLSMMKSNLPGNILNDLKSNFLIDYTDNGQVVEVTFVNPNLVGHVVPHEWTCPSCGAYNTAPILSCEYCGSVSNK